MQILPLPNEIRAVVEENNGLNAYLANLERGHEPTERSWLYEDRSPEAVLNDWLSQLEVLEHGTTEEKEVFRFDTSQLEKWGPQGGVAPIQDLMESIVLPTFNDHEKARAFRTDMWDDAVWDVYWLISKQMSLSKFRPASYKSVLDDMRARDTLESNSGFPLFSRRNNPEVLAHSIWAAQHHECYKYPAIALFRNYNQKTRLVWMFPMAANLVEGSFTQPLQSYLIQQDYDFLAPWKGFDRVRELVTRAYDRGKFVYASDFSSTDEHFRLASSLECLRVLEMMFQSRFSNALRESIMYMHQIPLIIGPNKMVVGEHGVASGSNWTNFIETIFDWIFGYYVSYRTGVKPLYAIGDDMAWVTDKYDDAFQRRLENYGKGVGQVIKAEKTNCYPDKVKTLQRLFQRGYRRPDGLLRAVYPTVRALKSSVYPERFHKAKDWSSDMFCARQYMILENCVDHPLFKEFVKFVVAGQKDLLPFAKKSPSELAQIHRKANLIPGLNPTYNQEKRDQSLEKFESIAIARML